MIRRVLEGGAGWERGGREDKSRDSGERARFADNEPGEEAVETGGES